MLSAKESSRRYGNNDWGDAPYICRREMSFVISNASEDEDDGKETTDQVDNRVRGRLKWLVVIPGDNTLDHFILSQLRIGTKTYSWIRINLNQIIFFKIRGQYASTESNATEKIQNIKLNSNMCDKEIEGKISI